jgi:hypothetical protein
VRISGLGDYAGNEETISIELEAGETVEEIINF